jgi:3-oxoacyl-[acyl-carrier-protein] synthase II
MTRRVVITGVGSINPMGHDVAAVWQGLKEGRSGVGPTTIFDASQFPTNFSAEVKNWQVDAVGEDLSTWEFRGRHSRFAAGAARQAVNDAGILDLGLDPQRLGIYLGSGE